MLIAQCIFGNCHFMKKWCHCFFFLCLIRGFIHHYIYMIYIQRYKIQNRIAYSTEGWNNLFFFVQSIRPVPIDFFSYRPIQIQLRFLSANADADSRYKENKRKIWTCIYPPNFHQYPRQFFPRQLSQNLCFWRFILEVKWVVKSNTKTPMRIHDAFPSII